ncbi:MAG: sodium-dependent transporter [Gemmatimonadetes bacterium]|nr:sodium-dependent transporter [Gemmatimonadota bacterium]
MHVTPGSSSRDTWGSQAGFILAAVGSAVGLGNMWRFSYVASQGGGAAFVLLYLGLVAVIGIPLMTSEFVVGRLAQVSPVKALPMLGGRKWTPLGWMFVFAGLIILSYYSVIAGWTMRYAWEAVSSGLPVDTEAYFNAAASGPQAIGWHVAFMVLTIIIVAGGIKRGIERTAVILMPVLFVILAGLAVYGFFLTGSREGYAFYLNPNLGNVFDPKIIGDAAGQAFFSLSLGMGALITFASYLKGSNNLAKEATIVALTDFGVAFMAGLVVFPIVFTFGLQDQISESGVGALFISLPAGFASMGAAGRFIGSAFFIMLFFAALTSSISLLEVVVSAIVDSFDMARRTVAITMGTIITIIGVPSALSLDFLGAADALVGNFLLILGGLLTAIFVGYVVLDKVDAELAIGLPNKSMRKAWAFMVRYVAPPILLGVLYLLIAPTWQAIRTLVGLGN